MDLKAVYESLMVLSKLMLLQNTVCICCCERFRHEFVKLEDYLAKYGFSKVDSKYTQDLYFEEGIDAVMESISGWDDSKHDYSRELLDLIKIWDEGVNDLYGSQYDVDMSLIYV